ncbi:MAG: bifunctional ornithine acetyltransferase/N-acetylglutamate synthase, partial [Gemmataceae bacterium]|nr:bifunctional ornithine acetyltransferase/N-acetylglutamate synthase [Gemmataceae bacterium]MDW8266775.1 bifunctional ornithine acetyltransferase/N-acetylglutamate synthase [Gemmataceae bacterium]
AQVLVCSRGIIGRPLPRARSEPGMRAAAAQRAADATALQHAAQAILTTDTRIKVSTRAWRGPAEDYRLTGFAKGAAMIGPNLATMLAFLLTDAPLTPQDLTTALRSAVDRSFNCISVDGHTSTNDTVLALANGGGPPLAGEPQAEFQRLLTEVCTELARAIAADAEGAQHLVVIEVEGLRDDLEARRVAKAVADSPLVKTAIFGADPNWGRIVSAAGYAGVAFEEAHLSLWLGDHLLYHQGQPQAFDPAEASAYLRHQREVRLRLSFPLGLGRCTFYTSDLTYDYVRLNAEYTT